MEPLANCFKNFHSPLYDRRLMMFILKKSSCGRRSFTENCRTTKIKDERRYRQYEPEVKSFKENTSKTADAETETQI
jgi:hypothetical protein